VLANAETLSYGVDMNEEPIFRRVVRWYDKRTRNWVVQVKDAEGNQVGDADYSATEKEAKLAQKWQRGSLLPYGRVTIEKELPKYA
jgi:hypothetical protein